MKLLRRTKWKSYAFRYYGLAWQHMPNIYALEKWRQEDQELKASFGYTARSRIGPEILSQETKTKDYYINGIANAIC